MNSRFAPLVALCSLLLIVSSSSASAIAADEPPPLEPARLQLMLDGGDDGMIVSLFRRHPSAVLPFFDGLLEEGLAEIEALEKAGTPSDRPIKAVHLFRRAIRFASLADQAFGDSVFATYANSFASWNATERARFREGQRLFRDGRAAAKEDPATGIPLLEASLALAQPLGDTWGMAMAHKALAEAHAAGGAEARGTALVHARRAAQLYGSLRLMRDEVSSLRLAASLERADGAANFAEASLRRAMGVVRHPSWQDLETATAVRDELAALLVERGRPGEAAELKATPVRSGTP